MDVGLSCFGPSFISLIIEPGQRSIDTARRILRMAEEINLPNIRFVANKITDQSDEAFITKSFPDQELLGIIPYSEEIRGADRHGCSVLDQLSHEMVSKFEGILDNLKFQANCSLRT